MTVKLHCTATADLLLLSSTAKELLGLLGKQSDKPGIIEPSSMPSALATLKALKNPPGQAANPAQADIDDDKVASFSDEGVSLYQHAWPLIQMLERAQAAGKPIVWGV